LKRFPDSAKAGRGAHPEHLALAVLGELPGRAPLGVHHGAGKAVRHGLGTAPVTWRRADLTRVELLEGHVNGLVENPVPSFICDELIRGPIGPPARRV